LTSSKKATSELIHDIHNFGINVDYREIFLNSHVSDEAEEAGVDWRMATKFNKNIRILTTGMRADQPILIHMHTVGGNWEDGLAVYDIIKSCTNTHITILAYAHARSMSSIIFQGADTRIFMPNTVWLMHMGDTGFEGHSQSFEAEAEESKKDHDRMLDIYTESAYGSVAYKGKSYKQVKNFIDKGIRLKQEWYMSAKDAISHGYGDAVFGDSGYEDMDVIKKIGNKI
jgi:ATP-dependent protease ClpP protease subunit